MSQMEQIRNKCKEVYAVALRLYGLDLTPVRISFDLRGRAAGKAGGKRYADPDVSNYFMKFNRDMLTREAFDYMLNETVPHEIAHIVCFAKPELGKNHDHGWARVCRALGGTGARTHKEDVVYGKGTTYEYTTDRGVTVRLSERRHRYVQAGGTLNYRSGKGTVTKACAHAVVGYQGRTLAEPIRKVAATVAIPPTAAPVIENWTRERLEAWRANASKDIGKVIDGFTLKAVAVVNAAPPPAAPAVTLNKGESKAATARRLMLSGHQAGHSYETIIAAIMAATGHDRQLARATYKANATKVGVPQQ